MREWRAGEELTVNAGNAELALVPEASDARLALHLRAAAALEEPRGRAGEVAFLRRTNPLKVAASLTLDPWSFLVAGASRLVWRAPPRGVCIGSDPAISGRGSARRGGRARAGRLRPRLARERFTRSGATRRLLGGCRLRVEAYREPLKRGKQRRGARMVGQREGAAAPRRARGGQGARAGERAIVARACCQAHRAPFHGSKPQERISQPRSCTLEGPSSRR